MEQNFEGVISSGFLGGKASIGIDSNFGAKYAILPGDPGRVEVIARFLENPRPLASRREYTSWIGEIDGENILVVSTGMGGPSVAICVEELKMLGVETVIRIGTCGAMQVPMEAGDRVVPTGAIRQEGTTHQYIYPEFPAVPSFDVTAALKEASEILPGTTWLGVVQSKDSLYGQHSPERMPIREELTTKYDAWIRAGALASEMECAAVFIVSQIIGLRSGAVLNVNWNREAEKAGLAPKANRDMTNCIQTVIGAIRILMKKEK